MVISYNIGQPFYSWPSLSSLNFMRVKRRVKAEPLVHFANNQKCKLYCEETEEWTAVLVYLWLLFSYLLFLLVFNLEVKFPYLNFFLFPLIPPPPSKRSTCCFCTNSFIKQGSSHWLTAHRSRLPRRNVAEFGPLDRAKSGVSLNLQLWGPPQKKWHWADGADISVKNNCKSHGFVIVYMNYLPLQSIFWIMNVFLLRVCHFKIKKVNWESPSKWLGELNVLNIIFSSEQLF